VTCDQVREHLPEHLLGVLDPESDREVKRHLRGCGPCRAELTSLGEGLATFARAAHQTEPPEDLKARVLAVLEEEHADQPAPSPVRPRRLRRPQLAWAVAAVVLAGALAWGSISTVAGWQASERAAKYETFLNALGGKDVRVAILRGTAGQSIEGSVVVYDSDVGQSWVLVLARSPSITGTPHVFLISPADRIQLHPLEFDQHGEASTWLVTSANLAPYDRVRLADGQGHTLAVGHVTSE
jgi:anti-sigma factor RsiW